MEVCVYVYNVHVYAKKSYEPSLRLITISALGPLLCEKDGKWYLHGISSFGHDACAIAYKYGVYTRVSQFKHWVKKVTGIDC